MTIVQLSSVLSTRTERLRPFTFVVEVDCDLPPCEVAEAELLTRDPAPLASARAEIADPSAST